MIEIENLTLKTGIFQLSIDASIKDSEYFVLLGMTGSGKTLLLECLCGLRESLSGTVVISGKDITHSSPRDRRIGYVPQEGALFGHLSVDENIAFGLRVSGLTKQRINTRVKETAELLGISHLLGRRIKGLSGGERQRIALARAIICSPSVLLLDEPVCALDEFTREGVCRELKKLQRELRIPVIHVCHSFEEASLIADKIGIMQNGRIAQTGTIEQVQSYPVNEYVARMLKLENLFSGVGVSESRVECNGMMLRGRVKAGRVDFVIRPWQIKLGEADGLGNRLEGVVAEIYNVGPAHKVRLGGSLPLVFYVSRLEGEGLEEGMRVGVSFPEDAVYMYGGR